MTTFSQLVDDIAFNEFNRPHMRTLVASFLNQTIRDVHSRKSSRSTVKFGENLRETEFVVTEEPAIWAIPSIPNFQILEAFYLPSVGQYLTERLPSNALGQSDNPLDRYYWYRTGSAFALGGVCLNQTVRVAYYQYPRSLAYFEKGFRLTEWDEFNQVFTFNGTAALEQSTNWLIRRYSEQLKEGVREKMYLRLGDDTRIQVAWSRFEALRGQIHLSEGV